MESKAIRTEFLTIKEVAAELRISERWLADECRAKRVEHIHMAGSRRFTRAQVEALIRANTVAAETDRALSAEQQRVLRELGRRRRR
jgi:hypothetical protein